MRPQAAHFFALASSLFLHALIKSVSAFSFALAALAASAFGSGGLSFLGIEMKVFAVSVGEDTRDEIAGSLCHACSCCSSRPGSSAQRVLSLSYFILGCR